MKTGTLKVDCLARVEGEGALYIKVKGGQVKDVRLKIFEPPRFFEAFLRGRHYSEAPDITARICGICPVAYQMSAAHAMEDAFGVKVDGQLRALRRLKHFRVVCSAAPLRSRYCTARVSKRFLNIKVEIAVIYCGEWIESHSLHIFLLHAPDFLGYEDAFEMAKDHRAVVERGLRLKKAGNEIIALLGGREIHPINVRVGGFYKLPTKRDLLQLADALKRARDEALETVRWTATLNFPDFEQEYEFVALRHANEYPFNEGRIVSNRGLDIAPSAFDENVIEEQAPYSNALHSTLKGRGAYLAGPLARYNLNFDKLSPLAREAALEAGLSSECRNPFRSVIVRSVEVLYACDEALRIIDEYEAPDETAVEIVPRAGVGYGCTEAPRGLLYHRYRIDEQGLIADAKIVPPTSQNQRRIETDLRQFVPHYIDLPKEQLTRRCEQAVRNYDPCISCATHFLRLEIERE